MNPRLIAALALAVGLLSALLVLSAGRNTGSATVSSSDLLGSRMPPDVPAPDFSLTDEQGQSISMRQFRGQPAVVTFIYTNCEDSCPVQLQQIKGAFDQAGRDYPALAVAVDPPRDTPESAQAFLTEQRMTGRVRVVLGSAEDLRPVWDGFFVQPQAGRIDHQARTVLIDKRGFQRSGFPVAQATPEAIAHDLKLLADE